MKTRSRQFRVAVLIGVLYLFLFLNTAHQGFWTADNGLKYLAIRSQVSHPMHPVGISLTHAELDPWKEVTPLIPPFVNYQEGDIIPVFSPLFIVLGAVGWKLLGVWVLWWIPWLAALGLLVVVGWGFDFRDSLGHDEVSPSEGHDGACPSYSVIAMLLLAVASPLSFYALNLWEHTISLLFLMVGIALTWAGGSKQNLRPYKWVFGGFLLGVAGMFRLEAWVVAVSWVVVSFWDNRRGLWLGMLFGLIVAFLLWIVTNIWWTGSWLPMQFSENWMAYGFSGKHSPVIAWGISRWDTVVNLLFSAHPNDWVNLLLNIGFVLGILFVFVVKKPVITKVGYGLMVVSYLVFLALEITLDHPVAATAFTGGLLWCCPWVVFVFPTRRTSPIGANKEVKRLLVMVLVSISLIILLTPISQGIHFGPRILLGVIPLFAVIASRNIRPIRQEIGWRICIWVLLFLTILHQLHGIQLLKSQKRLNSVLNNQVAELKEEVIVTDLWWIPCDLARAWDSHSFFLVRSTEVLQDLLYHMKATGINNFTFCSEFPSMLTYLEVKEQSGGTRSVVSSKDAMKRVPPECLLPIQIVERQQWKHVKQVSPVIERGILSGDSLRWADVSTEVGLRQLQKGFPERALGPFQATVDWNPNNPDGWYNLGMVKLQMGDIEGARIALKTAVSIDSNHQESLKMLERMRNQ